MANSTLDNYIQQFENQIANAGIDESLSLNDRRIIRFINIGAVISGLFCLLVLLLAIFIMPDLKAILVCLFLAISYFGIPFINRLRLFHFTKLFVVLFFSSAIVFWNLYISDTPYFLILPFTVACIFYPKNLYRIVAFIVFFAIFILLKYLPYNAEQLSLMFYDFCLFFSVVVLIGFTHENLKNYEQKMTDLNNSLKTQNKELEQQQQLKKSEQFFRSIFENNQLGIIVIDVNGKIKRINPAFGSQIGYNEEDILNRNILDLNVDKSTLSEEFRQLTNGEVKHFEVQERFVRKDQEVMNAQLIVNGVYDAKGDFIEAIITIQDITETYQTQEALKESELKFRTLFDNSPIGITIRDIETDKIVEINQGALDALGVTREAFFKQHRDNYVSLSTDLGKDKALIQTLIDDEANIVTSHKSFYNKKGKEFFAEITRSKIHINDKDYIVSISKDVTADIAIEKERKVRYQEMQTFFDALPISFLYLDTNNTILRANKIAAVGNPQRIEGKKLRTIFPEFSREYEAINQRIVDEQKSIINRIEQYHFAGQSTWMKVDRIPVKDEFGVVTGIIVFSTDITDIKAAEEQLALKNAELQHYIETNLQLESFAYIASHDLKEPLRMIHSFTQLLNRRLKPHFDENATEYMNYILNGVHRMQSLLEDLLKYSTIGRNEKDLEQVDLNDTIYNVVQNVQHTIKDKNAEIIIEPLPKVKAFPIQMVQLFQNLISNALKFVPKDRKPTINIKVKDQNNAYQIEVKDNGIGIQKEYLEKIFLVFKRLHGKKEYEGTGIGLATCKKIIENLNGRIWVESEYGEGTSFFFTIPK